MSTRRRKPKTVSKSNAEKRAYCRAYYAANRTKLLAQNAANYVARKASLTVEEQALIRAKMREKYRQWDEWERQALLHARGRAKKLGMEFTLKKGMLELPILCPVLLIPLVIGSRNRVNSPSLDRFDNRKGYTPENVRVISIRANILKRDATADELECILMYMRGL